MHANFSRELTFAATYMGAAFDSKASELLSLNAASKIKAIYGITRKLDRTPEALPGFNPDSAIQRRQQFEQGFVQPTAQRLQPASAPAIGLPAARQSRARGYCQRIRIREGPLRPHG